MEHAPGDVFHLDVALKLRKRVVWPGPRAFAGQGGREGGRGRGVLGTCTLAGGRRRGRAGEALVCRGSSRRQQASRSAMGTGRRAAGQSGSRRMPDGGKRSRQGGPAWASCTWRWRMIGRVWVEEGQEAAAEERAAHAAQLRGSTAGRARHAGRWAEEAATASAAATAESPSQGGRSRRRQGDAALVERPRIATCCLPLTQTCAAGRRRRACSSSRAWRCSWCC